ncbi:hypothetical protein [Vibrio cyclitrophicus]|uniref:hypothetical protein n=1 Tax=Vibrio cyclitrophicus TaxID=47951 RepID=UPI003999A630
MDRDIQQIPLNSIKLDQTNVRFGGDIAQSQQEAIELMMSDEDDLKKLVRLASHIATHGLDPTELQLVIPSEDKSSYIVIEGNRRLTALKMLQNPALCPVDKYVKQFRDASTKLNGNLPTEIACSIVKSRTAGEIWVKLKHTGQNGGVGRVNWDSDIRDAMRTRSSGIDSIGRQVRTLITDNSKFFNSTTINGIKQIHVTTLTRLFSSAPAQKAFQLKIENRLLTPQFPLQFIAPGVEFAVSMFVNEGYNVNDIRNDPDRKKFINHIPPELLALHLASKASLEPKSNQDVNHYSHINVLTNNNQTIEKPSKNKDTSSTSNTDKQTSTKPVDNDADKQKSTKPVGSNTDKQTSTKPMDSDADKQTSTKPMDSDADKQTSTKPMNNNNEGIQNEGRRARQTSKARKYLFPWTLKITNSRINEIYRELKGKLIVEDTPNATAIIFRVLLETSCDDYVRRFSNTETPVRKTDNNKLVTENDSLHKKVVAVSRHLKERNILDPQYDRAISKRASSHESIGSVDHLNMFVHSTASSPIASELKDIAQEYKPLLDGIWS